MTQVALKPGLFQLPTKPGESGQLFGSKCSTCGSYYYPKRYVCLKCEGHDVVDAPLSKVGKVWSYTVVHQPMPGALSTPPYVIAVIRLPEQVSVWSVLTGCTPEQAKIGMEVELTMEKVTQSKEGDDVVAFKFRPTTPK